MGLAASQARLLTITARLADNELRSQTINNAKMRLATQSAQASEDYVNALNNARLMFTNTDINGLSQTQVLNFNNLTAYSPYNTQYGLVNSAGLALVSETEAKYFKEANGDINKYLKAHGLEWETTYFNDKYDEYGNELNNIQAKLQSFYGTESSENSAGEKLYDLGYLFNDLTSNLDFKELYEKYNANELSIERTNYEGMSRNYYNQLKKLYSTTSKLFRRDVLGDGKNEDDIIASIIAKCGTNIAAIKSELMDKSYGSDLKMGLSEIINKQYITPTGKEEIEYLLNSLVPTSPASGGSGIGYETESYDIEFSTDDTTDPPTYIWKFGDITIKSTNASASSSYGDFEISQNSDPNKVDPDKYTYNGNDLPYTANNTTLINIINSLRYVENAPEKNVNDLYRGYLQYYKDAEGKEHVYNIYQGTNNTSVNDALTNFLKKYFDNLLGVQGFFNSKTYAFDNLGSYELAEFKKVHEAFQTIYGIDVMQDYSLLLDFEKLMQTKEQNSDTLYGLLGTDRFQNVVDAYKIDLMINVLGEPKYTWIDEANMNGENANSDAKAQWYTNLFNRMQKGYKVLEDGLAASSKWLEYAFESGLASMEQVDRAYNWNALSYTTCSCISEETDSSEAVALAEAKYKRAMNDIQAKDKIYDLQLKNIDTEHNSLQTEYESIQKVISKNIERTMKFDQSA